MKHLISLLLIISAGLSVSCFAFNDPQIAYIPAAMNDGRDLTVGSIYIEAEPEEVWEVVANPYEFEGKISHNLKKVEVLMDEPCQSLIKMTYDMPFPFPDLKYAVYSAYKEPSVIFFHNDGGPFKDLTGTWAMYKEGTGTRLGFSTHLETGWPVPAFLTNWAVQHELPNMLTALKRRVEDKNSTPVGLHIQASLGDR